MSVESFVSKTLSLLEQERATEIEETQSLHEKLPPKELQRRGVCLLKLRIVQRRTGLYGRTILTFEPFWAGKDLPSHNISPGDIVGLSLSQGALQGEVITSGIVSKVGLAAVSVAFDESQDTLSLEDEEQYKLVKLANDVTYKRLKRALNELNTFRSGPANRLVNVLFEQSTLSVPSKEQDLHFCNENLDDSQKEAVKFALRQREIGVIHGPPGTGKTTTVLEIIVQAVRQGQKVLACAPSNIAVDNLVERLANQKVRILRIGHPARLLPHIQKFSLDAILSTSDETKIVEDVRRDVDKTLSKMKKSRNKGEKYGMKEELKQLRKELRQREAAATREVLKRADVVLVTLTSATDDGPLKYLAEQHFDLTIIDECSQALEAACWLALLRAPRCILAGDHQQLPPTIMSHKAAKEGLEVTLMERVLNIYGEEVMRMLTVQYRMNELIMQWSSDQLYNSKLTAHTSVKTHLLRDLDNVVETEVTSTALLLIDTAGCDLSELDLPEEVSKGNEGEADIVTAHVEELVSSGLDPNDIAVIAPYNLQVDLLRVRLSKYPKLEIKSVDGFQGREKEAVIISMVRSNTRGEVGFLAENRRINVAITRARRHLAVICDSETVCHNTFLKSLVDYLSSKGEIRSAEEYLNDFVEGGPAVDRPAHVTDLLDQKISTGSSAGARPKQSNRVDRKPIASAPSKDGRQRNVSCAEQRLFNKERNQRLHPGIPEIPIEEDPAYIELEKLIGGFMKDMSLSEHRFPLSRTARDRYMIHEIAEKFGLSHMSQGQDEQRHIVIQKIPPMQKIPPTQKTNGESVNGIPPTACNSRKMEEKNSVPAPSILKPGVEDPHNTCKTDASTIGMGDVNTAPQLMVSSTTDEVSADPVLESKGSMTSCQYCGKNVIQANLQLHELHCSRMEKGSKKSGDNSNQKRTEKITKKENRGCSFGGSGGIKVKNVTSAINGIDRDDFEALVAAATEANSKCNFKKCKTLTSTLGQNCEFCSRRFCLNHHIPEIHGCGDEAKVKARQVIIRDGILQRGSGFKETKPNPDKKARMQRKLDKKLTELSEKRNKKPSKKS